EWPEEEIIMLAHLIGDGCFVRRQPMRYANSDEENLSVVSEAPQYRGTAAARDRYAAGRTATRRLRSPQGLTHGRRNPIAQWLDDLGLFGLRSHEKFVPSAVFSLPRKQVALFLRHLWATDGSVFWDEKYGSARIYYSTTSRKLVDDVASLL